MSCFCALSVFQCLKTFINYTSILLSHNEKPKVKPNPHFVEDSAEVEEFIKDLFDFYVDISYNQTFEMRPILIRKFLRERKMNPVKILYKMLRHPFQYSYTSLLGFFYQYGIGTVADSQMAFKFFSYSAQERIENSSYSDPFSRRKLNDINKEIGAISLADMYLDGLGVEKDAKKAFQIFSKLADEGSHKALNCVAYCYTNGFGVEKNYKNAFELFLKSAERGNFIAQYNVGFCYTEGMGTERDEAKGFEWYTRSALSGSIDATNEIGYCYGTGIGVCEDKKEAFRWYLKGAENGDPIAQNNIGLYYANGYETSVDLMKAFEWYRKAAENDVSGQYVLGKYFYEGYGTKKDIINAVYWLDKAKKGGNTDASELLEEITSRMP